MPCLPSHLGAIACEQQIALHAMWASHDTNLMTMQQRKRLLMLIEGEAADLGIHGNEGVHILLCPGCHLTQLSLASSSHQLQHPLQTRHDVQRHKVVVQIMPCRCFMKVGKLLLAIRGSYTKIRASVKAAMQSLQEKSSTQSTLAEVISNIFDAAVG